MTVITAGRAGCRHRYGWPVPEVLPFRISVADEQIEELRRRLRTTRWPDPPTVGDWSQGWGRSARDLSAPRATA